MANYFDIRYESTAASSPGVELNYGASTSNGLTVHTSLYAGLEFTPTHYKMWGVELVSGEGVVTASGAEWIPFTSTRTITLAETSSPQYAYVKFKNVSEQETSIAQSNAVTFSFTDPSIHSSVTWETVFASSNYDTVSVNKLVNTTYNTEVELSKSNIAQLKFSGRNFSGLDIQSNSVTIDLTSQLGQLISQNSDSFVSVSKTFETSVQPLIIVYDGETATTLTTYDADVRSTLSDSDSARIDNISWNSGTKTLSFDAYAFSTYSFSTVQKVEFTADTPTGGYVGSTATLKVYVQDTNGEGVENAPVTLSGIGDNVGSFQESMPVSTNASGIAEFNLDATSLGTVAYDASVDGIYYADEALTFNSVSVPSSSQRSLLTQFEQIYKTSVYSDSVSNVNTSDVAEPTSTTISGSSDSVLEHDMNVLRTLMKQIKGTSDWFSELPTYFDPSDTDGISTENAELDLSAMANNTLDAKTILLAVNDSNSGAGFSVSPGDAGFLFDTTLTYADLDDRRGLPIYSSTTNSGTYYDEGGLDRVVGIDLLNMTTASEFRDISGNIIYAKFHDAADYSGTGEGTDSYVKFYTDDGSYTLTSGDPTSIMMVYPYRKVMSDVAEHEWTRTDFVSSWEGDSITVEKIVDLWSYTGASNDEATPVWTTISGSPLVDTNDTNIYEAIDSVNDSFGDRVYVEQNYTTSGESITDSLDALDIGLSSASVLAEAGIAEKYIEVVVSTIDSGTSHQLPIGVSYTQSSSSGQYGKNLDVFLDGQLLTASTGLAGVNEDGDYSETSPTHITFHIKVHKYSNITYKIRA